MKISEYQQEHILIFVNKSIEIKFRIPWDYHNEKQFTWFPFDTSCYLNEKYGWQF